VTRKVGSAGLDLIKSFEKLRLVAYLPTKKDVPTIGWGHTRDVELGDTCTVAEADAWLAEDCADAERAVRKLVKLPITDNQFDALVSFVFNVGEPAFAKSTLLRKLNSGDYAGAASQFGRWNKQKGVVLNGLTRRRGMERALFLRRMEEPFSVRH
jgi:lysozyme